MMVSGKKVKISSNFYYSGDYLYQIDTNKKKMKATEFRKLIREEVRRALKEASINDVPKHPMAAGKKATDPVFDYKNNNKPKYPITIDVISMKPIEFGVDYKTPLDLVWLDGLDSPENKYGLSGFTLKTNIPANKQKRITKNTSGTSNYLKSGGY